MLASAWIVYRKELKNLGRDRHTLIYSVLLPVFLYPILVWGTLQVLAYLRGVESKLESTVLLFDESPEGELASLLAGKSGLTTLQPDDKTEQVTETEARERMRSGEVAAVVTLSADPTGAREQHARIFFRSASDTSLHAKKGLEVVLEDYRKDQLLRAAQDVNEDSTFLEVLEFQKQDLSTRREVTNYVVSLILPLLMIVMTAMGALYPALDSSVGEKERGTLETTLSSPIGRFSMIAGKYGAVVTFSLVAFALNFASMGFTLSHLRSQANLEEMSLGLTSILIIVLAAILLAGLLSALMMFLGFLARSFKEGQAYVTPVYVLSIIPAVATASPEMTLTPTLSCIPIVNISLLFREALNDRLTAATLPALLLTLAFSAIYVLLALLCAARLLRQESLTLGEGLPLRAALRVAFGLRAKT
jgi:sodium transport system permease protein